MRKIFGRHGTALAGTLCALLIGMTGTAEAEDSIIPPPGAVYRNAGPVNVKMTGGEVLDLRQCLADAQDGIINYAQEQCDQIAIYGDYLELQDVNLFVYPDGSWATPALYRGRILDVWTSGGSTVAIIQCLSSIRDGTSPIAINMCSQAAGPGNMIVLSGVGVYAYQ
ncbi:MAG: hypothetical protein QG608_744 [Actinomycetota bacterium]|nr:hypothetical protein [Actinomycetota bacterium]